MSDNPVQDLAIEGGRHLIDALTREGVEVQAAFWMKNVVGEWRLNIITPDVMKHGPRATLKNIAKKMASMNGKITFELYDIDVLSPQNPEMLDLFQRTQMLIGNGVLEKRVRNVVFDDSMIDDSYFYFVNIDRIYALE